MTATTLSASAKAASRTPDNRILAVTRLHFVNRMNVFGVPWMILGFIFLINLIIWWIIFTALGPGADAEDAQQGLQWSGASFYIFVYMMVLAIQAVSSTFPFALGYTVSRREFALGTALSYVILAALYGAGMTVLAVIEEATGGWGFGGRMFTTLFFGGADVPWFGRFLIFFALFAFFLFFGGMVATLYQRFRVNGMLIFFGSLALVLVGLAALATWAGAWPAVGEWFVANGAVGVIAWSAVPTALSALAGYLVLRKATPKN